MRLFFLSAFFSCLVTITFSLTGCSSADPIQDLKDPSIALDGKGGPEGDCSGEIPFTPIFTQIPVDGYPGFDLALEVSGNAPAVPPGCTCGTTTYTFYLDLDCMFVLEVGVASSLDPSMNVDLVYEDLAGFAMKYRAPTGWNDVPDPVGNPGDNPFSVCISATDGDVILFDFYGGNPGGPSSSSVVDNVGGICIVDNIGKSTGR